MRTAKGSVWASRFYRSKPILSTLLLLDVWYRLSRNSIARKTLAEKAYFYKPPLYGVGR